MRVVVTGGGSGGHVYPALAVASALRHRDARSEIVYIGGTAGMEAQIVPESGLPFTGVATRKLTKLASPDTFIALVTLLRGYREARTVLREWKPDAAVGTGGYVAAATILAAARLGIPSFILSPDAVAGRTNRWLSRWAQKICLWLGPDTEFPAGKIIRTGHPIRPEVVGVGTVTDARERMRIADRFTILVIGGSQGAQRLNELVVEAAGSLPQDCQILHQTGERNFEGVCRMAKEQGSAERIRILPYFSGYDLPYAYRSADLLVCRCGVGMLAEGTANGLPLIMVPLPTAYADHQTKNAEIIERQGGGVHLSQTTLSGERLAKEIIGLRNSQDRREAISNSSRTLGHADAADKVASIVLNTICR